MKDREQSDQRWGKTGMYWEEDIWEIEDLPTVKKTAHPMTSEDCAALFALGQQSAHILWEKRGECYSALRLVP